MLFSSSAVWYFRDIRGGEKTQHPNLSRGTDTLLGMVSTLTWMDTSKPTREGRPMVASPQLKRRAPIKGSWCNCNCAWQDHGILVTYSRCCRTVFCTTAGWSWLCGRAGSVSFTSSSSSVYFLFNQEKRSHTRSQIIPIPHGSLHFLEAPLSSTAM